MTNLGQNNRVAQGSRITSTGEGVVIGYRGGLLSIINLVCFSQLIKHRLRIDCICHNYVNFHLDSGAGGTSSLIVKAV